MRRVFAVLVGALALVLAGAGVATATVADAGSASLSIHNVQEQDSTYTGVSSRTVEVGCPPGQLALSGFGSRIDTPGQFSTIFQGSRVDSGTWSVTFPLEISKRYVLLVTATCLEV